jgi:cytochrome c biogenesis protein CcmG, thiol:disulfide interchange protein DsbE
MTRGRVIGLGIVLLAVGGLVVAEIATSGDNSGRPAPQLPTQVLSGHRVTLASLHGKPAVINFWASWCGPCKKEAPELERLAQGLHGTASLVGVDWNDSTANARSFVSENHWSYPVLRDGAGEVGNAYGLTGLPTTFVLNPQGDIVETLRGPQTTESLQAALSSVD